MNYSSIMIRFGELSTKGKNKKDFISLLAINIKHSLKEFPNLDYDIRYDHIYIILNETPIEPIIEIIKSVSGIHSFSLVYKIESDIEKMKDLCLKIANESEGKTFKVNCKRSNKNFPLISDQIVRTIAPVILKNTELRVDVHNPDISLNIEVRDEGTYIFTKTILGAGGYPVGAGGKILMMLSGGIDSPVASYLLIKRGVLIECVHFASPPYTNDAVIDKLKDILKKLNKYQFMIRLHIIPFTKLQTSIYDNCPESYAITIMRRMMYRISEKLCIANNCLAIANGESIGQVASQTLDSMKVIEKVTDLPVIRPLATYDKLDIIKISEKIETYEISIRPFEDCCTIFSPKNPKTKPQLPEVLNFENKFDFQSLIDEAIKNEEIIIIK